MYTSTFVSLLSVIILQAALLVVQSRQHIAERREWMLKLLEERLRMQSDANTLTEALVRDSGKTITFRPLEERQLRPTDKWFSRKKESMVTPDIQFSKEGK